MRRGLLTIALTLALAQMAGAAKPECRRVYVFGFAASLTDSVAYITDIQTLDTAYVYKNGFLADRSLYSMQLNNYLLTTLHRDNMTCMVFFDAKRSKLEKKYLKVRKNYRTSHAVVLSPLGSDAFLFRCEEWIEPVEMEMPEPPPAPEAGRGLPPGGAGTDNTELL